MKTLADLKPGEEATVVELTSTGLTRERLQDLGIVPGTRVRASLISPLGDPVAYEVRGALIALRRPDAATILIENGHENGKND
ncbi:MAG: ferrous iron transport protein A [Armatimonadetes bacterium]|nr:MAG: ferrous iron transport protein A [Armatimonadota bacterium]GIV02214.1 MAG: ferrous iron transport protein A [Fimbriimonadales bacterium]